ncbi:MAG: methyltransferase, partial [Deltaproteobacteria bacterium]|nr:methyltransferase [Deltaproteobacteria bacterium]
MGGPPQQPDMPPGGVMMQMLMGRWLAQTISAVAKLGVADHVGDHPTPVADLARAVGANEDALYRALRALAMVGVVAEAAPRAFVLTPIGKTLRSDAHDSLRDVAILFGHETHNRAWTALDHAIKTNKPALEHVTGKKGFELLTGDPEMAGIFNRAMTSFSRQEIGAILHHYDFSGIGKITDVGGGHGLFLGSILQRHAAMKGALFDLPVVVEGAHAHLGALGVADRVEVVGGDFFETAPPKSDAIVMKHIIHDWDDQASVKILG